MFGCRPKTALTPPPSSIESLCLVNAAAPKVLKLPSFDMSRNDRLAKGAEQLHVDIEAAARVAIATTHEVTGPAMDEDAVRLYVTEAGGGIIAWWRGKPVVLHYAPDSKEKTVAQDVYAIAIPDKGGEEARVIYVLSRPAKGSAAPHWRAVETADDEHVCM